jgi:hypothetical protein
MNLLTKKRKTWETSTESLRNAARPFERVFGVRCDPERLDDDEREQFAELARKATSEERGVNLSPLGRRERAALERLLEKAAGEADLFERRREEAAATARIRELAERAVRPSARPRFEERGAVILPRAVFEQLRGGYLWVEHVGLLAFVVAQMENGVCLAPQGRYEDGSLVIDHGWGLTGSCDGEGTFSRWKQIIEHLERNAWLDVERSGRQWRITRGRRLREAGKARAAA